MQIQPFKPCIMVALHVKRFTQTIATSTVSTVPRSSCFMFYKRYTSIQTREKCTHNGVSVQNTRGTLVPPVLVLLGHQKFQYFPKLLERLISAVQPQLLKYYGPRHQETL
jgi:hypothetical protein